MNKEEMMSQIAKMENELVNLKEELNKQEEPKRRWKPELHDKYYCIDSTGTVCIVYWEDWEADKRRYALGNVFKTQEEAEFAVEQLKILVELKEQAQKAVDAIGEERLKKYYFCVEE